MEQVLIVATLFFSLLVRTSDFSGHGEVSSSPYEPRTPFQWHCLNCVTISIAFINYITNPIVLWRNSKRFFFFNEQGRAWSNAPTEQNDLNYSRLHFLFVMILCRRCLNIRKSGHFGVIDGCWPLSLASHIVSWISYVNSGTYHVINERRSTDNAQSSNPYMYNT